MPVSMASNARTLPWVVKAAAICLIVYALVVVVQPFVLAQMDISLGRRTLARMLVRVVGALVMAWGLARGLRWAWWLSVVFLVPAAITGVLGVLYPGRFGHVHLLANTVIAPIAIVALIASFVFVLLPRTRTVFLGQPAGVQRRAAPAAPASGVEGE